LKRGSAEDSLKALIYFGLIDRAATLREGKAVVRCLMTNGMLYQTLKFIRKVEDSDKRRPLLERMRDEVKVAYENDDRIGVRVREEFAVMPFNRFERNCLRDKVRWD
jgi:hypothetical protein